MPSGKGSCQRRFFKGFCFSLLIFITARLVHAASGTEGGSFLDIPVGAGPAALGSAYSALATDAYAPIYNPAGLGFVTAPELSAQHLSYLESINYEFGSFVFPLAHGENKPTKALGTSIQYLGSGSIAGTDPSGAPIGDFNIRYTAYSLAYGQQTTDQLSLGITGKVIEGKIADVSARAYAADLGALYKPSDCLAFSATVNNLGSKLAFNTQGDSLPLAYHLGAAYQAEKHWKATAEGVYSKTGLISGRFGTEWRPLEAISMRAGYKTETTKELSPLAGLTVGLGIHLFGQEFAYAWLPYGDLGDTQYFSLLLRFGKAEEDRKNLIEYQTIKTHRTVRRSGKEKGRDYGYGPSEIQRDDPEYQQLMQLLSDEPERNALAPVVGTEK